MRASLLATRGKRGRELLDAAAIRVGVELDLVSELARQHKRRKEEEEREKSLGKNKKKAQELTFLQNNIGKDVVGQQKDAAEKLKGKEEEEASDSEPDVIGIVVDSDDEFANMKDDERRPRFSAYYKKEMARQKSLTQPNKILSASKSRLGQIVDTIDAHT